MKDFLTSLILALGIAIAGIAVAYAIYSFKAFDRYVSVKGLAQKTVKANKAVWQIRVNAADDNLSNVYQQINQAQSAINTFLTSQGFNNTEISLTPIDVTDHQSSTYNDNKAAKRYSAQASVILDTDQVDKVIQAQQQISHLVQQGIVLSNSQVSYLYTKLNDIKPQMLDAATANARLAAESFANNSHSHLGSIRSASQGLFTITDVTQQDYRQNSSVTKNVRVVTTVDYYLR